MKGDTSLAASKLDATERRTSPREKVSCRSAIWFDDGPSQGIVGTLIDLSKSGFQVQLLGEAPKRFKKNADLYCVILVQGAHLDCMARIETIVETNSNERRVGFSIQTITEENARLLSGFLQYLKTNPIRS